ncbi:MAG: CoA ester lyase [Rhodospirillaceae bacterium]|nr:CoA ester lyase [Rhodospirillaceae bacterium]MBT3927262.1 CoA ester lyase [Rhodospirillaceae bacterium]MBT5038182.1 CoA ester lyase [Rhodospirillaceae bacterium]MBT5676034.1 CoA ester lyase [Rhodospirillaceae bacterium]MBT5779593.1 CoA ester lyase [Rhodospirillaceae bacterium]
MSDVSAVQPRRSLIFTPGNRPDMFPKGLKTGADIVTVDLEDAIAPQHKDEARDKTLALFANLPETGDIECMVRVNTIRSADGLKDLSAIIAADTPPAAIMLPKVKSAEEIELLDELLIDSCQNIRFHVIIETNDGLDRCYDIAKSSQRIDSLLFGAVDMAAELRVEPVWEPLFRARSQLVHAAAGAGLDLIDVPFLDLEDMAGLKEEAERSAALGFTGKGAIHPKQIATLNEAFSPTDAQIDYARRVIQAFEEGDSGLVLVDNKLIEKPVLRSMYRILAVAEAAQKRN